MRGTTASCLGLVCCLAVLACASTEARCRAISSEDLAYRQAEVFADQPTPDARAVERINGWSVEIDAAQRKAYAAVIDSATVEELTKGFGFWSSRARPSDSVVSVLEAILARGLYTPSLKWSEAIPPRPSDQAWYAEHCWEGKPR